MTDPHLRAGQDGAADETAVAAAPLVGGGSSSLADGEWHRLHPLTPLFKGGIALIIVITLILGNLRDRITYWFVGIVAPHEQDEAEFENGDPIGWFLDWTLSNNLVLVVLLAVLAVVALVSAGFGLAWRAHQFRITGEDVEVRKGIIFRSHRRAPLDRVQGVNLTRPFLPRLFGMAKLEVDGAGTDANVPLEYLSIARAEEVRADILRLASGARAARRAAREGADPNRPQGGRLRSTVSAGVQELIEGADVADVAPESVVKLPVGRIIGSQLLEAVVWVALFGGIFLVTLASLLPAALIDADGEGLVVLGVAALTSGIPMAFSVVGVVWRGLSRALRYSIAPTPDGVRVTQGLLTTVTQTIPPGRIHAVELVQPLLWKPFGWWRININRVSGQSVAAQASAQQQFSQVLPVGTRDDAIRVLQLILPYLPPQDLPFIIDHGMFGPIEGDPYRVMARRARWRRPASWKRHGALVTAYALLLRRGTLWRRQAILPLARLQGTSIAQGPIDRVQTVGWLQAHTVAGTVSGTVVGLDRADLMALFGEVRAGSVAAAAADQTHRWGAHGDVPGWESYAARVVAGPAAALQAPGAPVAADAPVPAAASVESGARTTGGAAPDASRTAGPGAGDPAAPAEASAPREPRA
ncbi:PH domain-containing protein [Microbacterium sp. Marseille-Q6965]|uniref:PH domain-containing protein n=1 Tax=Microbacterium sp. Marseille-Q6965 TaxID=2965072 RepID=UPI0021B77436|nr:PH domain-containing protein [Microbacterium sp. Marseille-Q6965]